MTQIMFQYTLELLYCCNSNFSALRKLQLLF